MNTIDNSNPYVDIDWKGYIGEDGKNRLQFTLKTLTDPQSGQEKGNKGDHNAFAFTDIADEVEGSSIADLMWLMGGDNVARGGKGNDTIYATDGDDDIDGGEGDDLLTGGGGSNVFRFTLGETKYEPYDGSVFIGQSPGFGDDTIRDFNPGQDVIDLSDFVYVQKEDISLSETQNGDVVITIPTTRRSSHRERKTRLGGTITLNGIKPGEFDIDRNIRFSRYS